MLTHSGDKPFKVTELRRTLAASDTQLVAEPVITDFVNHCVPPVRGGRLQRHLCLTGGAGPARPHSL